MQDSFAAKLIAWHKHHGRHDLPWQGSHNPYAIWVSEIMLQQTQVATVIPYYNRFMQRFPDIFSLGAATEEEVLTYWAGLGYYARGRNLRRAAQIIRDLYSGRFPSSLDEVAGLPGIGPSTAAAICAFTFGQPHAILDGNVKRVLARAFGVSGYPGEKTVENRLWQLSRSLVPSRSLETYTQALMDLGATVCTRSKPRCPACPLENDCVALRNGRVGELPSPRPSKALPQRYARLLVIRHGTDLLLEKRPGPGIWGGLWSLPETEPDADPAQVCLRLSGQAPEKVQRLPGLSHSFTHFRLHIEPLEVMVTRKPVRTSESPGQIWMPVDDALHAAVPAPVKKILSALILAA
ncbi:MAG TPA: A/G-specific adenine glycosylase [Thiobacillaceae bacterium]|nr:A/G-specific adenine glycosylase [Thiobacillaceae bacterium]